MINNDIDSNTISRNLKKNPKMNIHRSNISKKGKCEFLGTIPNNFFRSTSRSMEIYILVYGDRSTDLTHYAFFLFPTTLSDFL